MIFNGTLITALVGKSAILKLNLIIIIIIIIIVKA